MLLISILFFVTSLYGSENQIKQTQVDLIFNRPKNKSAEEFKNQLIDLVDKYEKSAELKKNITAKLEEQSAIEALILSVTDEQLPEICPYLRFIDCVQDTGPNKKIFLEIVQSDWVNKFHDKYQQSLSERSGISSDNLKNILGLLSQSIIEQAGEQDDFPSKEVQLLKLFNIVYKRIFVDIRNTIEQNLIKYQKEGKADKDIQITDKMYLLEVCKALQMSTLDLKVDQNNQILVNDSSINKLIDEVLDLITKRLEEESAKKEINALNISRFLINCGIPAEEFAAMSTGQQGMAIVIASILIDSSLGKEFSKNHYDDYKRMFLDLERIMETIKNGSILSINNFKNNYNANSVKNYFELVKNNIYLNLSKELMAPEFINTRCIIKDGKIYFNEVFLVFLIKAILENFDNSLAQNEGEIQKLQALAALYKSVSMPQNLSARPADNHSKKTSERQMEMAKQRAEQKKLQEEEAKRKQEEVERQKKAHSEKIKKAQQAKEEKAKQAALAEQQKAQAEAQLKELKRQKELEKQRALNEAKKKKEEEQERSRLLKVQLYEEREMAFLALGLIENLLLDEHEKEAKEALLRAKLSEDYKCKLFTQPEILSSRGFIHNPYAR